MENFGQTLMPLSSLLLLTALLQRQQVYVCFIDFQKAYEMVCFINLVLKSRALSHRPDSEHILKIVMCGKNQQSLYEVFHLHERITSGMRMPSNPNLFRRDSFLSRNFKTESLANFEFLRVTGLSTNCS